MVKLEAPGLSASFAAVVCPTISTFGGLPVSTTHTKTTAIMGVGADKTKSRQMEHRHRHGQDVGAHVPPAAAFWGSCSPSSSSSFSNKGRPCSRLSARVAFSRAGAKGLSAGPLSANTGRGSRKGSVHGKKHKEFDYFDAFEQQVKFAYKEATLLVARSWRSFKSAEDIKGPHGPGTRWSMRRTRSATIPTRRSRTTSSRRSTAGTSSSLHRSSTTSPIPSRRSSSACACTTFISCTTRDWTSRTPSREELHGPVHRAMGDFRSFKRSKGVQKSHRQGERRGGGGGRALRESVIRDLHTDIAITPARFSSGRTSSTTWKAAPTRACGGSRRRHELHHDRENV